MNSLKPGGTALEVFATDPMLGAAKDGFDEPVSVTQVGDTGWVAEGKLSYIIGDNKTKDPGPFTLKPVALPK